VITFDNHGSIQTMRLVAGAASTGPAITGQTELPNSLATRDPSHFGDTAALAGGLTANSGDVPSHHRAWGGIRQPVLEKLFHHRGGHGCRRGNFR